MEWRIKMKVLLVNGSPHKNGCTNEALLAIQETLKIENVDSDIYWIGNIEKGQLLKTLLLYMNLMKNFVH